MKIKNRLNPALLALFAALVVALVLAAGKGGGATNVAQAAAPNGLPSVANSALRANVPDATWTNPVLVGNGPGYDDRGLIVASPLTGGTTVFWGQAPGGGDGWVTESSNAILGGPFSPRTLDRNEESLNNVMGAAHDSLGRRHVVYWSWPRGGIMCDHYDVIDQLGNVLSQEEIPGSCDGTPRKLGAIAFDANNTAHIVLARTNQTGTMAYWERTATGGWTVVKEDVAQNCCPGDLSIAVTAQGVTLVAFKSTGISGNGSDIYTVQRQGPNNWAVADDISAECCAECPGQTGAYLPQLAADPSGGIRAVWADGRCTPGEPTDLYYREWVPGTGWNNQPLVHIVYNSGTSYYPGLAVDGTGEAHVTFSDDTSSPFGYYRIFYVHGRGTTFSGVQIPFTPWDGNYAYQKQSSTDYAFGNVFVVFSSNKYDSQKDNFYSYFATAPQPTPTPVATATPVPPRCPGEQFKDVCPGDFFYTGTLHLSQAGILSGYNTSPPCPNNLWIPCFLPYNNATRGQMSKIVVLAANIPINTTGFPHFEDVGVTNTFSTYVETAFNNNILSGYACGGTGEPCDPQNRPYFRPGNQVTRGQTTKMAALAFHLTSTPSGQTFQDVAPGTAFYTYTEQVASLGLIGGYTCGGVLEPCVPPANRPYYRPNNNVTRGQAAKILDGFRSLATPTPTATATATVTATVTMAPTITGTPPTETSTTVPNTATPTSVAGTVTATTTSASATATTTAVASATGTPGLRR